MSVPVQEVRGFMAAINLTTVQECESPGKINKEPGFHADKSKFQESELSIFLNRSKVQSGNQKHSQKVRPKNEKLLTNRNLIPKPFFYNMIQACLFSKSNLF